VTAGLVVAYLTDGRFKAPKDAAVEIVPGEPVTKTADAIPGPLPATPETKMAQPASGALPAELPGTLETRRPLPPPTTPQ
jgi:hypothetical protein